MSKKHAKKHRKMLKAAAKAPRWVREIAATKFDRRGERQFREAKLGTFGAASAARHVDPASLPAPFAEQRRAGA